MRSTDVLIVGAGPTGLSAASRLREFGLSAIVVEREQEPGGIPRHTEHLGYGMRDLHRVLTGPAYARRLTDRAERLGVDLRLATTVLDLAGTSATLRSSTGVERFEAGAILLATGVRERPRAARLVPGDRPAGVLTTGALQQFARNGQRVGRRAVIVGAEHVSFSAVLTLRHLGCEVAAMVTTLPRHQTYAPLRWATASRVPIRVGVDVARIVGRRRVEAVELSDGSRIACDTVVYTGDWVPDHELARRAGCTMVPVAKAPLIGGGFHTSVPGVFAAGNLVHPAEAADRCALDGRHAADWIQRFLEGGDGWDERHPGQPIVVAPPIRWASFTAGRITLRVDRFVTGRVVLHSAGQPARLTRPMRMMPNRAVSFACHDAPSKLTGTSLEVVGWHRRSNSIIK